MKTLIYAAGILALAASASAQIPSSAISSGDLNGADRWTWTHDRGTPGTSIGRSTYAISSPSLDGLAREFSVSYYHRGGERYHLSFGNDTTSTYFVYDTYVYIEDPSQIGNLELDLNQVLDTGRTVFLATQCAGTSGTWEYTYVVGRRTHWHTSNLACDPSTWTAQTWHHVQIAMHRVGEVVTHDWIGFDGNIQYFQGATGFATKSLGWQRGDLVLNVQPDGASRQNGTIQLYLDQLQVFRWIQ